MTILLYTISAVVLSVENGMNSTNSIPTSMTHPQNSTLNNVCSLVQFFVDGMFHVLLELYQVQDSLPMDFVTDQVELLNFLLLS